MLRFRKGFMILFIAACLYGLVALWIGCGQGGSSDSVVSGQTEAPGEKGTVALILADSPADAYEKIWIWIRQVVLVSEKDEPEVVYKSDDPRGHRVDLLDLRDQDFIFTVKEGVAPGTYKKIRLEITDIEPEGGGGVCSEIEVKLPSGRIELIPEEPFAVEAGRALAIRLDIDAGKSILLKEAGRSGKCIFRPVVFVEIREAQVDMDRCPKLLTGTIERFYFGNGDDGVPTGFEMVFGNGRSPLDVVVAPETVIFDSQGFRGNSSDLAEDQTVHVRGALNRRAQLVATEIAIGGVESLKGVVSDAESDGFTLILDGGAGSLTVDLLSDTLILTDCNTPFEGGVILPGASARVYGKFDSADGANRFRALLVLLKFESERVILTDMVEADGGHRVTIDQGGTVFQAFLPDEAVVKMEGGGMIDRTALESWVACRERWVKLVYDGGAEDRITLARIIVVPDVIDGRITAMDLDDGRMTISEGTIAVVGGATILKMAGNQLETVEMDALKINDDVTFFGIAACEDDNALNDFYAFVLAVE